MIESSRRHGHFDPRRQSDSSRPSSALIPAAEGEAPAGLDWYAFSSRYFPGRRRHDLGAVKAYEAYLRT
jgi:hypothetical protein